MTGANIDVSGSQRGNGTNSYNTASCCGKGQVVPMLWRAKVETEQDTCTHTLYTSLREPRQGRPFASEVVVVVVAGFCVVVVGVDVVSVVVVVVCVVGVVVVVVVAVV